MESNFTFHETLTVEQFKDRMKVSRIDVKKNPKTNSLFMSFGSQIGMVSLKGIPQHPMLSHVTGTHRVTGEPIDCWLLHEESTGGAPVLASF